MQPSSHFFAKSSTLAVRVYLFEKRNPMQGNIRLLLLLIFLFGAQFSVVAQHSVARAWNEVLLEGIRGDFARPTVHARNLFHISAAMYDAWAAYDDQADTYLLGKSVDGFDGCDFEGVPVPADLEAARKEAISYAAFRLVQHRFRNSPGAERTLDLCDSLMQLLGYDLAFVVPIYESGTPAALGNYIAQCYIEYGLQDYSNEQNAYVNIYYEPVNEPIAPARPGVTGLVDPNRWQAISLDVFIDQSGEVFIGQVPPFLSPEWGLVAPFALTKEDLTIHQRNGNPYWVYHDPGPPPYINSETGGGDTEYYQWGFSLVAIWSAHLDPTDGVLWDISPGAIGNFPASDLPTSFTEYDEFYDLLEGGDPSMGHDVNPHTGQPYEPQIVPRGDYTRVLAEFWADGPDSETPPGHWFTILNYVNDHPELVKKYEGEGEELSDLEWDVKSYFTLGGAMHDAAISAWGIKGWYDYLRPVSAIRYMASVLGQSTDKDHVSYHPAGIPLVPGFVELVEPGDPLAGPGNVHVGKIKLLAWRGPGFIEDPEVDEAGVGWILAENWWPYQRPTFVTPPFAGYISGHSTYSRAAAEVLTRFTGDPFFPGGMGEFIAKKNEFLVFEEGPSQDIVLQWATYRDASDQTSLSRIWGGIHPPADDIPGRHIGIEVGNDAFELAHLYFEGQAPEPEVFPTDGFPVSTAYPNPVEKGMDVNIKFDRPVYDIEVGLYNTVGQEMRYELNPTVRPQQEFTLNTQNLAPGIYFLRITNEVVDTTVKILVR